MNLDFIPKGWMTYIGVAVKLLGALLAILTAVQSNDLNSALRGVGEAAAVFMGGSAISSAGMRRALTNLQVLGNAGTAAGKHAIGEQ